MNMGDPAPLIGGGGRTNAVMGGTQLDPYGRPRDPETATETETGEDESEEETESSAPPSPEQNVASRAQVQEEESIPLSEMSSVSERSPQKGNNAAEASALSALIGAGSKDEVAQKIRDSRTSSKASSRGHGKEKSGANSVKTARSQKSTSRSKGTKSQYTDVNARQKSHGTAGGTGVRMSRHSEWLEEDDSWWNNKGGNNKPKSAGEIEWENEELEDVESLLSLDKDELRAELLKLMEEMRLLRSKTRSLENRLMAEENGKKVAEDHNATLQMELRMTKNELLARGDIEANRSNREFDRLRNQMEQANRQHRDEVNKLKREMLMYSEEKEETEKSLMRARKALMGRQHDIEKVKSIVEFAIEKVSDKMESGHYTEIKRSIQSLKEATQASMYYRNDDPLELSNGYANATIVGSKRSKPNGHLSPLKAGPRSKSTEIPPPTFNLPDLNNFHLADNATHTNTILNGIGPPSPSPAQRRVGRLINSPSKVKHQNNPYVDDTTPATTRRSQSVDPGYKQSSYVKLDSAPKVYPNSKIPKPKNAPESATKDKKPQRKLQFQEPNENAKSKNSAPPTPSPGHENEPVIRRGLKVKNVATVDSRQGRTSAS